MKKKWTALLLCVTVLLGAFAGSLTVFADGEATEGENILTYGKMEAGVLSQTSPINGKPLINTDPYNKAGTNKANELAEVAECQEADGNVFIGLDGIFNDCISFNLEPEKELEAGTYHFQATVWTLVADTATYIRFMYEPSPWYWYAVKVTSNKTVVDFYIDIGADCTLFRITKGGNDAFNDIPFGIDDISLTKVSEVPSEATHLNSTDKNNGINTGNLSSEAVGKGVEFDLSALAPVLPEYIGYQDNADDVAKTSNKLRLISTITAEDLAVYTEVGYVVTVDGVATNKKVSVNTVYSQLSGIVDGATVDYAADDYNATYFVALVIDGLAAEAAQTVTFAPYAIRANGERIKGESVTLTVATDGTVTPA